MDIDNFYDSNFVTIRILNTGINPNYIYHHTSNGKSYSDTLLTLALKKSPKLYTIKYLIRSGCDPNLIFKSDNKDITMYDMLKNLKDVGEVPLIKKYLYSLEYIE